MGRGVFLRIRLGSRTPSQSATNRELLAASLAARAAASSRSMKISASMACLPGLPLPFVGGVALSVHFVGVSERDGPSWALNGLQHRRATEWLMASLRPVVRFAERDLWNMNCVCHRRVLSRP